MAAKRKVRRPTIFISYRHVAPTTDIARKLHLALRAPAEAWGADLFMDEHDLEPADLFDKRILGALDRATHFIVLLTNEYWASAYCRKELGQVIDRFERKQNVRLLFVKAEELDPNLMKVPPSGATGVAPEQRLIQRVGDVQFLGPFNDQLQLVRLDWERPAALSDQLAQLVKRLSGVIAG